jgi:hypothetical protein
MLASLFVLTIGYSSVSLLNQNDPPTRTTTTRGVSHCSLAIYILRQKKNYKNSNILPCKNIIFKKLLL